MTNLTSAIQQKQEALKAENPFYGNKDLLALTHGLLKSTSKVSTHALLTSGYKACKSKEDFELFFIIMFSIGDIDRTHNLFKRMGIKKVDKGGNAKRTTFLHCLQWLYSNHPEKYFKMLPLIPEYTNFENILYYQLRTDRKKGTVLSEENYGTVAITGSKFIEETTTFLANIINDSKTSAMEHQLLAKFLRKPRFSTRKRKKKDGTVYRSKLNPATVQKELFERKVILELSKKCGWEVVTYNNNERYIGLEKYKAKYNRLNEDYMFSSKEVLKLDEPGFHRWLDTLPANARYRVQRRLIDGKNVSKKKWVNKYGDLADFYKSWLAAKEQASKQARILEQKGEDITAEERVELKKLQKQAKVTTGAINFEDLFKQFLTSAGPDANLIADNLLRNIKLDVPMLVIADNSGSMNHRALNNLTVRINVAALATTIIAAKNPDPEAKSMLMTFSDTATIFVEGQEYASAVPGANRFIKSTKTKKIDKIFDPTLTFFENYNNILGMIKGNGSTNLSAIASKVKEWVNEVPSEVDMRKEMFNRHQVLLVISDGDLNSFGSPMQSLLAAKKDLMHATGWDGILVLWDVHSSASSLKFEHAENVLHIPYCNANTINQVFNNLSDIDIIDSYAPLKALHNSNRYEPIKAYV